VLDTRWVPLLYQILISISCKGIAKPWCTINIYAQYGWFIIRLTFRELSKPTIREVFTVKLCFVNLFVTLHPGQSSSKSSKGNFSNLQLWIVTGGWTSQYEGHNGKDIIGSVTNEPPDVSSRTKVVSSDLRFIRHTRTPIKSNQIKTQTIKELWTHVNSFNSSESNIELSVVVVDASKIKDGIVGLLCTLWTCCKTISEVCNDLHCKHI
jgi:hypothetical protein